MLYYHPARSSSTEWSPHGVQHAIASYLRKRGRGPVVKMPPSILSCSSAGAVSLSWCHPLSPMHPRFEPSATPIAQRWLSANNRRSCSSITRAYSQRRMNQLTASFPLVPVNTLSPALRHSLAPPLPPHQAGGVRCDGDVPRHEPHIAELRAQVAVLLVAQRLDGRRVHHALVVPYGHRNRVLRHGGLAG